MSEGIEDLRGRGRCSCTHSYKEREREREREMNDVSVVEGENDGGERADGTAERERRAPYPRSSPSFIPFAAFFPFHTAWVG